MVVPQNVHARASPARRRACCCTACEEFAQRMLRHRRPWSPRPARRRTSRTGGAACTALFTICVRFTTASRSWQLSHSIRAPPRGRPYRRGDRPRATTSRSARAASERLCVTITIAMCRSRASSTNRSCSRSLFVWSRFPDGSSASRTAGSIASARATAVRCCSPPDSSAGRWFMRRRARRARAAPRARSRASAVRPPGDAQRHHHVLQRGELAQQMMKLEHEPHASGCAAPTSVSSSERCSSSPASRTVPRGRAVERAEHVQQRALPRAARADDRHHLAAGDLQIGPVEHGRSFRRPRPGTSCVEVYAPRSTHHSWRIASIGYRRAACSAG